MKTERFWEGVKIFYRSHPMQLQDVEKLIQNGESETVEFKNSASQCTTAAKTF